MNVEVLKLRFTEQWGSQHLLACQISSTDGLEVNDDVCDLQVPLLLQVGQDSRPEKDFTLADTEQVAVQLQGSNLSERKRHTVKGVEMI